MKIKRNLLILLTTIPTIFFFTGCDSDPVQVNVSNNTISSNQLGQFTLIGGNLVYDTATRIVYIENVTSSGWDVYTPYYAPNGLPYRYNPETNTFEEITTEIHKELKEN